jgi:hypothetical protein
LQKGISSRKIAGDDAVDTPRGGGVKALFVGNDRMDKALLADGYLHHG